jgi:hypothetical protein
MSPYQLNAYWFLGFWHLVPAILREMGPLTAQMYARRGTANGRISVAKRPLEITRVRVGAGLARFRLPLRRLGSALHATIVDVDAVTVTVSPVRLIRRCTTDRLRRTPLALDRVGPGFNETPPAASRAAAFTLDR